MLFLALLHPIADLSWWRWSIHPSTAIGIAALGASYVWAYKALQREPGVAQRSFFFSGLLSTRRSGCRGANAGSVCTSFAIGLLSLSSAQSRTLMELKCSSTLLGASETLLSVQ